jgi:4-amino-4-deoxy-L-arabinose transferase-like glycosyltransferase
MKQSALDNMSRVLKCLVLAIAAMYVIAYLVLVLFRIRYPFALEWLEESLAVQVRRILVGQKLYVSPSLTFVPFSYTPLYFYVSAAVSYLVGWGLLPLRLVSFVSSLGCFTIIFLFVKRETGAVFSAILASCLFAATFDISGAWFDIARVDSLFLFLLLAGLYLIKCRTSAKSYVLAGACISLSFLTKQTALLVALPMALYCICLDRRRAIFFVTTVIGIIVISTLILDRLHDGWYSYYIFGILGRVPIRKSMLVQFWVSDILRPLSIACGVSVLYFFTLLSNSRKRDCLFYILMAGGMVGTSWLSRLNEGGYDNVLFPAYAAIAILFGLAIHSALESVRAAFPEKRRYVESAVYLICILQFACLVYDPLVLIPTDEDLEAGRKVVDMMKRVEGDIFVPYHPYLSVLAGKRSYAHAEAVYVTLILDAHESRRVWTRGMLATDFEGYCVRRQPVVDSESAFWPITGVRVRPQIVMDVCPEGR